jgi:hypothetical protein
MQTFREFHCISKKLLRVCSELMISLMLHTDHPNLWKRNTKIYRRSTLLCHSFKNIWIINLKLRRQVENKLTNTIWFQKQHTNSWFNLHSLAYNGEKMWIWQRHLWILIDIEMRKDDINREEIWKLLDSKCFCRIMDRIKNVYGNGHMWQKNSNISEALDTEIFCSLRCSAR